MLASGVSNFRNPKVARNVPASVMVTPSLPGRTPNGSQNGASRLSTAKGKNSAMTSPIEAHELLMTQTAHSADDRNSIAQGVRAAMMTRMPVGLMLATLTERRDFGEEFLLERKFDGERCVARKDGGQVRLESRTANDLTGTYPEVAAAVASQRPSSLVLDGEVVAYDGDQTSFGRLQQRLGIRTPSEALVANNPVVYCVFDLLELDGTDLTERPLRQRRASLTKAIRPRAALQLSEAWRGDSERRFAEACRSGWEGLIAKRADAPYINGRSKHWLKLKCAWEQEFVIGGYTDPAGSRTDFGALLVGYYEGARLRYAGKVGTGFSAAVLRDLGARLREMETSTSSFDEVRPVPRGTHWTRPELVAQVGFAEWTSDGRLRQPRFLGLRDDKRPSEVVRERPQ
jgi:bifunctional non-homologous end joining protein LigD